MKGRIVLPLLIIAMLLPADIWAGTVTLDEALESAAEHNTDLAAAKINLETAIRSSSLASSYIPDISIDGGFSVDGMSAFDSTWGQNTGNLSLGISLDLGTDLITDGILKGLRKENAALDYLLSAESLEEAVVSAYWNLALSQSAVETARIAEEDSREALASVEDRYAAGSADELEWQEAKLAVLQYSTERQSYEDQLELAYTAFSELTGIEERGFDTEAIPEIPALSIPSMEELIAASTENSLEIQSLRKQLEIAEAETLDARIINQIPSVSLSASYRIGAMDQLRRWEDFGNDRGSVSIAFSIPVSSYIPGSSGYLAVKESEDAERIAALNLKAGQDDLRFALEEDITSFNQASRAVKMAMETRDTARRAYELRKERFDAGYETQDELSDARKNLLTAELDLSESRINQLLSLWSISFDTGMGIDEIISRYGTEDK